MSSKLILKVQQRHLFVEKCNGIITGIDYFHSIFQPILRNPIKMLSYYTIHL